TGKALQLFQAVIAFDNDITLCDHVRQLNLPRSKASTLQVCCKCSSQSMPAASSAGVTGLSSPNMRSKSGETNGDERSAAGAEVSRSQRRRDALDVLKLAQTLSAMSNAQLETIPVPDDLREEVRRTRQVKQQIARKRQDQFLAKQMRKL